MESTVAKPDVSCSVFNRLAGDLDPDAIHRFVVGEDAEPRTMSADEAGEELGDPFATLLLLEGKFPRTGAEALEMLAAAAGDGDPLAERRSFVLGEGSQLIEGEAAESVERRMRFVVATGSGEDGPDVIVSSFDPDGADVELMAWDRRSGGFNFYRTVGKASAWVFAGNSRHALSDPTQGKGPFESHTSGALLMKELEIPWSNWHSFEAPMPPTVFADGDPRGTHPWFTEKEGAEVCEVQVAIPSMERWARARFDLIAASGTVSDPKRVMQQVLATPTVNLISSRAESREPDEKGGVRIPPSFFFSSNALGSGALGLSPAPIFQVPTSIYRASVEKFAFALRDPSSGFEQKGDTKFAFLVPERAREDDVALAEAIRIGLLTPRLAAALLMVDFPNPIFSDRRRKLLEHVPASATIEAGASGFSEEMAGRILAAAEQGDEGSPEREFAQRWEVGEDFAGPFDALLGSYFDAVRARLATQEGFDDYVRVAESRRRRAKDEDKDDLPIIEFPLLFPQTNIPDAEREIRPDGTIAERSA
jgi:hypothetical protein